MSARRILARVRIRDVLADLCMLVAGAGLVGALWIVLIVLMGE